MRTENPSPAAELDCPGIPVAGDICEVGDDLTYDPTEAYDDITGGVDQVVGGVEAAADGASGFADFASDPFGYMAEKAQAGAQSLAENVLPAMTHALEPNLAADWFLEAYRVTFALAIFVWVLQLVWMLVQHGRREISSSQAVDVMVRRSPLFFAGCMFGPAAGWVLVKFIGVLTDDVVKFAVGGTAVEITEGINDLVAQGNPATMVGGSIVALIVYLAMIVALLFLLLNLVVLLVTLYLSGVAFPLGWQWITSATHHDRAMRIVRVWVGVLLTPILMFLMLGVSLRMATGTVLQGQLPGNDGDSPESLRWLLGLLVTCVALWMTALSPVLLAKFAPVLPTDGGGGLGRGDIPLSRSGSGGSGGQRSFGQQGLAQASQSGPSMLDAGGGGGGGGDLITPDGPGGGPSTGAGTDSGGDDAHLSKTAGGGSDAVEAAATEDAAVAAEAGAELGPADVGVAAAAAVAGGLEAAVVHGGETAADEVDKQNQPGTGGDADNTPGADPTDSNAADAGSDMPTGNAQDGGTYDGSSSGGSGDYPDSTESGGLTDGSSSSGRSSRPPGRRRRPSGLGSLMDRLGESAGDAMNHQHRRRD